MAWPDAQREAAFWHWFAPLAASQGLRADTLATASADASFRRYLRVQAADGGTRIVMDAPAPQEDVRPFIDIAGRIAAAGLHAPAVLAADVAQGFVLLTDLGRQLYLPALQAAAAPEADRLMRDAVAALHQLLRVQQTQSLDLQAFLDLLQRCGEEKRLLELSNEVGGCSGGAEWS